MDAGARELVAHGGPSTLYIPGEFFGNYHRILVRDWKVEKGPYAQYDAAYFVTFRKKGARNYRRTVLTYHPRCAIVVGHDGPIPESAFGKPEESSTPGVMASKSRRTSFDPGWDAGMTARLDGADVAWSVGLLDGAADA